MKPLAIDLFCGKGGWTNALLDVGFRVIGFDLVHHEDYRGEFHLCDVFNLFKWHGELRYAITGNMQEFGKPDFAVCSSPCEQFSVHCMKHFHKNPPYPELGIKLFNHSRNLLESLGIPYVMENVRCAEKFVGRAVNHCGPFYLWGNAVPAVFPREAYTVVKGLDWGSSKMVKEMSVEEKREYRAQFPYNQAWSTSKRRMRDVASAAMIPYPISRAVAEAGMRLVEDKFVQTAAS